MPLPLDHRRRLPAWTASFAIHVVLGTSVVWLARPHEPQGAADEPSREVGVVLRQSHLPLLDSSVEAPSDTSPSEPVEPVPPKETPPEASSPFAELLKQLAAEGASPPPSDPTGTAEASNGPRRPQPSRPVPRGQTRVSVFGVEGTGSRFVYAFDRSVSMRGPPLSAAKRQLIASFDSLESVHQFQIVFFNHRLSVFDLTGGQRRIAQATEANKRQATDFVMGVTADGSTDRYAALVSALRLKPDVVFFLTDVDGPMSYEAMAKIAKLNDRIGATINTIEFGRGPPRSEQNFLKVMATQSGGQHGYVDTLRLGR